ncbi:MAG TPA: zinc-ribbon domain-containing protein, partial [Candidatus Dojkabacteria bacterium]|nr:zinc-ribbon domain-containing protein [Candidatus Dojkabacteria bacterium]
MKYCTNCGEQIDNKAVICPKCGVAQPSAVGTEKNKLIAALLAIFLGG